MRLEYLETPALIVDLDALEHNIEVSNRMLEGSRMKMRPHYKSHKCPAIAHMQIDAGAKGITCSKISESEDLIASGIEDVLIANQIVHPAKIARLAYLAKCCHLTVCVDHGDNILDLQKAANAQGSTIHCLIEYEIGMKRCGVDTPEAFYELVKIIEGCPNLTFDGIQAYAGNLSHEENYEARALESLKVEERLSALKRYVEEQGSVVKEVSGASTGTIQFRKADSVYTEVQAGSYIFMDMAYGALDLEFKNSLFVLTSVLVKREDVVITDAGRKSVSVDQKMPVFKEYPQYPVKVSEEHSAVYENLPLKVGDKLKLVPGHCCTTMNLHDYAYLVRQDMVVDRIPVVSRGRSL